MSPASAGLSFSPRQMKTIHVLKAFLLNLQDHTQRPFRAGLHEVEEHIADHWFVKAHSEPVAEAPAPSEPTPAAIALPADEPKKTKK